jgi:hypothetical protein
MKKSCLLAAIFTLFSPTGAQASLIGDEINGCWFTPGSCTSGFGAGIFFDQWAATVGPGVEFTGTGSLVTSADFTANSLTVTWTPVATSTLTASNEVAFFDLDWIGVEGGSITGIEIVETDQLVILSSSFGPDWFRIQIQSDGVITGGTETSFTANILTTHSAVPIPATVWLFGSGLLGLVGMARHKKAS